MRIEVACEKHQAYFNHDIKPNNFPFYFIFMDRTSNNIIEARLDGEAMAHVYKTMKENLDLEKLEELYL